METDPAGNSTDWTTTYTGQEAGLENNGVVTITNQEAKGSIVIEKDVTVNGNRVPDTNTPSPADGTYTFTITKKDDTSISRTASLAITNGQSTTEQITDLQPGTYIVTETVPTNGSEISMIDGDRVSLYSKEVTVGSGQGSTNTVQVVFTNNLTQAKVKVIKVLKDNKDIPISGAEFTLTRVDEQGHDINTAPKAYKQTKTVSADGELEFDGLLNGRYKLEETFVPAGYIKTEGPYYIEVDGNGTSSLVASYVMASSAGANAFYVENTPGAALPNSGGPGTTALYLLGIMLTASTGVVLVMRKKRREAV